MENEAFERVVKETIDELPKEFKFQLDNVEIVIEDYARDKDGKPDFYLFGLYHGVPKTERNHYPQLPDKISIYKEPILMASHTIEEAKERIKQTVLHELGHHFGLSDEELEKIEKT